MAKQQKTRERVFDLKLRGMMQVDLSSVPVCVTLDFDDPLVDEVLLIFREDCYGTKAEDSEEAQTKIVDKNERRRYVAGETISYFFTSGKIWLVTASGQAVAGAVDKEIYEQSC